MIPDLSDAALYGGAVFLRAGALLAFVPFAGQPAPVFVRVALAMLLAYLAVTTIPQDIVPVRTLPALVPLVLTEALIGLAMAFAVQKVFILCQIAGSIISNEAGLMQGNALNPLHGQQESLVGTSINLLALVLFFSLGLHRGVIAAFLESLRQLPPMSAFTEVGPEGVVLALSQVFLGAVQIAAPFIAMNFIVVLAFGALGRAAPEFNVLFLSFPARLLAGLLLLVALTPFIARKIIVLLQDLPDDMIKVIIR